LVSIGELPAGAAAAARRRVLRRAGALLRGDARRALRLAVRFTERFAERFADRFAGRFAVFFLDIFLLADLRDFAVFFAILRRFLAMRAPPGMWRAYSNLIIFPSAC
jgi:hypothetical protein